jgi:transcriptional regulator with XRE-family HTH domain
MLSSPQSAGDLLRAWRQRRRMTQLDLALEAEVSTRHLSFVETGRAQPSREMLLHLSDRLQLPLRERNALLLAGGFAPAFPERPLADPALRAPRAAIDLLLAAHEPYPALAIDRHWTLVAANGAVNRLLRGVAPSLLAPPVNVLRLSLHPEGLARRIANLAEWRGHLLARLQRQVETSGDPVLAELKGELAAFGPARDASHDVTAAEHADVIVPFKLTAGAGVLSFISTTTVFGTPVDVTLSELAIESFFPADAATAEALRALQTGDRR